VGKTEPARECIQLRDQRQHRRDNDQINARVDQNISNKQRLFARYTRWSNLSLPIDPYKTQTYIDRGPETFSTRQLVIADTYTFSPTTIGDFRVAYLRFVYDRTPESLGVDLTTFGLPASLNNQVAFRHIPTPCVQGYTDVLLHQWDGEHHHRAQRQLFRRAESDQDCGPPHGEIRG